jgi:hypothetical protein
MKLPEDLSIEVAVKNRGRSSFFGFQAEVGFIVDVLAPVADLDKIFRGSVVTVEAKVADGEVEIWDGCSRCHSQALDNAFDALDAYRCQIVLQTPFAIARVFEQIQRYSGIPIVPGIDDAKLDLACRIVPKDLDNLHERTTLTGCDQP